VQAEWAGEAAEAVGQTASIPPLMRFASKVLLGVE